MRPELKFVKRLQALFGPPCEGDTESIVVEYVSVLAGQSAATLERAADILARKHKFRNWPTVAECLDAVAEAKRLGKASSFGLVPIDDFGGWWAERLARVSIAKTERDLTDQVAQVEPYASAGWIMRSRLPEIIAAANNRRREWQADAAGSLSKTQAGGCGMKEDAA